MNGLGAGAEPDPDALQALRNAADGFELRRFGRPIIEARIAARDLETAVRSLADTASRFADFFVTAEESGLILRLVYGLDGAAAYLVVSSAVEGDEYALLSDSIPAAFIEECEAFEKFGVLPRGSGPLNRVVMPPYDELRFPLSGGRRRVAPREVRAPHYIEGEAFEFPFGPVRVASWESLYTGLVTTGEEVLDLYLFYWHKHRGIERRLLGLDAQRALFLVERAEGLSAVGNGLAFCRAVEAVAGVEPPLQAACARVVALYVLAFVGFGFKAGLLPLHIWLPEAHPVAPADGSGFLSGMVIKLGVYGIMLFAFELVLGGPAWWGVVTMTIGALSAVIGVLYAVIERDFKWLLAFHSIENIGIIVTAAGAAMIFGAYGEKGLRGLLLIAALYHVVNHGTYKTLLFMEAGVVEHAAGTRDLDQLGGLIHRLRASSAITLIGILAIAGLPPLNGFVSEWLIFQGLFQGFRIDPLAGAVIVLAGAALALSGGLAIMAFAHAYGIAFLGMPRTQKAADAEEAGQPTLGPGLLAVACVALGIGAPAIVLTLDQVVGAATGFEVQPNLLIPNLTIIPAYTHFSSFSPTYLAVFLFCIAAVPLLIYAAGGLRNRTRIVPVWDGGMLDFKPRMQYTGTAFANPVRVTFDAFYRPNVNVRRASDDPAGRSGPVHYDIQVLPLFQRYLYRPVIRAVQWLAETARPIQSGDVNLYLLYIFVVVIISYLIHMIETL